MERAARVCATKGERDYITDRIGIGAGARIALVARILFRNRVEIFKRACNRLAGAREKPPSDYPGNPKPFKCAHTRRCRCRCWQVLRGAQARARMPRSSKPIRVV